MKTEADGAMRQKAKAHLARTKRLPPTQVAMLELLIKSPDYTYVTGLPTLRALHFLALAEMRPGFERQWRITRNGVACLKQNGHWPITLDLADVRDPRASGGCSRCGGSGVDPELRGCRCDCCDGTGVEH